jgi:hypothetical protein
MLMSHRILAVLCFTASLCSTLDAQAPRAATTAIYDVEPIIGSRLLREGSTTPATIDDVAKALLSGITPFKGPFPEMRMRELSGTRLEIETDAETHRSIASALQEMKRDAEVTVTLVAELREVDREFYDKHIAPELAKRPGRFPAIALEGNSARRIAAASKPVSSNKRSLQNGGEEPVFSFREARLHDTVAAPLFMKSKGPAFHGISLRARMTASADRRSVHLKVTQRVAELLEMKTQKAFAFEMWALAPYTYKEATIEVPVIQESTFSTEVAAKENQRVLLPVFWRPPTLAVDRVWFLLLEAAIIARASTSENASSRSPGRKISSSTSRRTIPDKRRIATPLHFLSVRQDKKYSA